MFWYPYALIGFSIAGMLICRYIDVSKKRAKPMVCPLNGGCDEVVNSKYSKTFGVSNEVMGALYYLAVIMSSVLFLAVPATATSPLPWALQAAAALAFAMSCYLMAIQIFVLRHLCTWCMATAVINGVLLPLTLGAW